MTLEEAWKLLESLNEDANQQSQQFWMSDNINEAIHYQSECFRNNFLKLETDQQYTIIYWLNRDDEFKDYVKCLAGNDFINLF
jgi:tRNA(Ile)-lysidine synthase TilS/MesJ